LKAELISAGTELLLGEIVDTNAVYLSQKLAENGVDVYYRHTVGDNLGRLVEVLRLAFSRADAVIVTGGLGPTQDDITREAIAKATSCPLVRSPEAVTKLRAFFARRGRIPTENNLCQAEAPQGASLIDNEYGTAPGIRHEYPGGVVFALPGPPAELHPMFERDVLPYLLEQAGARAQRLYTRALLLADIGESNTAEILRELISAQTDPTIALYASPARVRVRLATKDTDEDAARRRLDEVEVQVRELLGEHVFGADDDTMEVVLARLLRERAATLAVTESCTGGMIASRITDVAGASDYFLGGIVAYSNDVKQALLGVSSELLQAHGAVSELCAAAMADGVRSALGADYSLATTGIAGPAGGTDEKPVGLVYIAVADQRGTMVAEHNWPGTREQFKQRVSQMAFNMLRKRILGII
jgi:nicotinamide-nucleotide amidase